MDWIKKPGRAGIQKRKTEIKKERERTRTRTRTRRRKRKRQRHRQRQRRRHREDNNRGTKRKSRSRRRTRSKSSSNGVCVRSPWPPSPRHDHLTLGRVAIPGLAWMPRLPLHGAGAEAGEGDPPAAAQGQLQCMSHEPLIVWGALLAVSHEP